MRHVAIIGAGPVGLTLAHLLARRGVRVTVAEAQLSPYPFPRAIHFDGETMRIFQAAGVADAVLPHTHPGVGMLFRGPDGQIALDWTRDAAVGSMGWRDSYRFYQPGVEAALAASLAKYPQAQIRRGVAVTSITQEHILLADGAQIAADFIVGCDGANAVSRHAIGSDIDDLGFRERWLVADLRLTRPRPDLGDHSVQYCDVNAPATYVRGAGEWRRWEMRLGPDDAINWQADDVWPRLSRWITPEDATLERAVAYEFRSAIATKWRTGRVFIAGDAAHQMPPFMGQGMCAGIRDAANLAWKLTAAGHPDDPLLDSYQSERAPHVRAFIEMTMRLGRLINQTSAGIAPSGTFTTIQPALGPGIGERRSICGHLAPQFQVSGQRLDDRAKGGFYALAQDDCAPALPCFNAGHAWLDEHNLFGAVIRPDGYVFAGAADRDQLIAQCGAVPMVARF